MTTVTATSAAVRSGQVLFGHPDASTAVSLLLERLRTLGSTEVELGYMDIGQHDPMPALEELAAVRRSHLYGFRLSCQTNAATAHHVGASRLRAAGIYRLDLLPGIGGPARTREDEVESTFLSDIALVGTLHEQGVGVTWLLALSGASDDEVLAVSHLLPYFHHIPPPVAMPCDQVGQGKHLSQAVEDWRRLHQPNTLTYGRGPGFVRIFDRRAVGEVVTFVTLEGPQAELFLAARTAAPAHDLALLAVGVGVPRVRRFLDVLVERRLMCRTKSGLYQSVATRRRMEERWVEGDG